MVRPTTYNIFMRVYIQVIEQMASASQFISMVQFNLTIEFNPTIQFNSNRRFNSNSVGSASGGFTAAQRTNFEHVIEWI